MNTTQQLNPSPVNARLPAHGGVDETVSPTAALGRLQAYDSKIMVQIEDFSFGRIIIDGVAYEHDVVIDHGKVRKRKKGPSKKFRDAYGHTPLSAAEDIPWKCRRLVIGTGAQGNLPVMDEIKKEAAHRHLELVVLPTAQAIKKLRRLRSTRTRSSTSPADSFSAVRDSVNACG